MAANPDIERLLVTFREWDTDGNGYIDEGEMAAVFEKIGMRADHAKAVVKAADVDFDGRIDYEEFTAWLVDPEGKDLMKLILREQGKVDALRIEVDRASALLAWAKEMEQTKADLFQLEKFVQRLIEKHAVGCFSIDATEIENMKKAISKERRITSTVSLSIKQLNGDIVKVDVDENCTLGDLKFAINQCLDHIHPSQQSLLLDDGALEDDGSRLQELGIGHDTCLTLLVKSPAYKELECAIERLQALDKRDFVEIAAMSSPPTFVNIVVMCVVILQPFGEEDAMDGRITAVAMLKNEEFLEALVAYNKEKINEKQVKSIKQLLKRLEDGDMPEAVYALLMWVHALIVYYDVKRLREATCRLRRKLRTAG